MGDFYTGNTFPTVYNSSVFYSDVGLGFIYVSFLNGTGAVNSTQVIDNIPYVVDMQTGADGNMYYVSLFSGEIGRWRPA